MPHLFDTLTIREVTFPNRIMMSPMCQYMAEEDGRAQRWHMVHYGSRAVGGAGLIMVEATAVDSAGRISAGDLGLWEDEQIAPLAEIVSFCHELGIRMGVQIAHAGRKAWSADHGFGLEEPVAPSAIPFDADWRVPHALNEEEIGETVTAFGAAARRAREAGFDVIEIHGAHGYLISEFLSPLTNARQDAYGGGLENRARFANEVIDAVRAEWPASQPLFMRLSCTDWADGGNTPTDAAAFGRIFRERGVDLIDCSSGGVVNVRPQVAPGYQVPFAEQVRRDGEIPTAAVGMIFRPRQADRIVDRGQADLIALGRALLRMPYWPQYAARRLGAEGTWPTAYGAVEDRPIYPEVED